MKTIVISQLKPLVDNMRDNQVIILDLKDLMLASNEKKGGDDHAKERK